MEVTVDTYKALRHYFTVVGSRGYVPSPRVTRLVLLVLLEEFTHRFAGFLTASDYRVVQNVVARLYGSDCMIPFPGHGRLAEGVASPLTGLFHGSERLGNRVMENDGWRTANGHDDMMVFTGLMEDRTLNDLTVDDEDTSGNDEESADDEDTEENDEDTEENEDTEEEET